MREMGLCRHVECPYEGPLAYWHLGSDNVAVGKGMHKDCWNAYMRAWRAAHPKTDTQRTADAERARAYRSRLRVLHEQRSDA